MIKDWKINHREKLRGSGLIIDIQSFFISYYGVTSVVTKSSDDEILRHKTSDGASFRQDSSGDANFLTVAISSIIIIYHPNCVSYYF